MFGKILLQLYLFMFVLATRTVTAHNQVGHQNVNKDRQALHTAIEK